MFLSPHDRILLPRDVDAGYLALQEQAELVIVLDILLVPRRGCLRHFQDDIKH